MKDFRVNWQMPALPLGPARKQDKWALTDADRQWIKQAKFEQMRFDPHITEADCRQVAKGAATAPHCESVRGKDLLRTTPCAAPAITSAFKKGDRVRVLKQAGVYEIGATGVVSSIHLYDGWIKADMSDGRSGVNWKPTSLELIAPTNTAEADAEGGWIAADGKNVPTIALGTRVLVRLRTGEERTITWREKEANERNLWDHREYEFYADRMAYRILD